MASLFLIDPKQKTDELTLRIAPIPLLLLRFTYRWYHDNKVQVRTHSLVTNVSETTQTFVSEKRITGVEDSSHKATITLDMKRAVLEALRPS